MQQLDETDLYILRCLQSDAKMSIRDLSKEVHLSATPIHSRIKRLEESGIIQSYNARINFSKISDTITVICHVSLKQHNKISGGKFIKTILSMEEVVECFSISGEFDFMLKVICNNMDAYYNFHVHRLSQIENVGRVQSTFVIGTIKDEDRSVPKSLK